MTERDLPQGIKAPPLQPIQPNFTVGDNMTTLNELLAEEKRLTYVIDRLANRSRLNHVQLVDLGRARADRSEVRRQITEKEYAA